MTTVEIYLEAYALFRQRTTALLEQIEQEPDPAAVLGWRPGPGRAHIAWQLMHIAATEELFATERLLGTPPAFADLIPRFRGGSTPDDQVPAAADIRRFLVESREHLAGTLSRFGDDRLEEIPPALAERGLTVRKTLQILAWHEAHHQGQAHLTRNLYRAALTGAAR